MALTNLLPMWGEDEFDDELALECGYTEEQIDDRYRSDATFEEMSRFNYVQDVWECSGWGNTENHDESPKYYYNPETNNYDAPKPLTLKEQAEQERLAQ